MPVHFFREPRRRNVARNDCAVQELREQWMLQHGHRPEYQGNGSCQAYRRGHKFVEAHLRTILDTHSASYVSESLNMSWSRSQWIFALAWLVTGAPSILPISRVFIMYRRTKPLLMRFVTCDLYIPKLLHFV